MRAAAAAAAGAAVVLRARSARHSAVKEHVAVCFQLEAPVADVIGGARLRPHALELALHDVHRNQREQHAEQKGNRDPDQGERLLGQIAGVIDIAVLRLGDELVGKLGVIGPTRMRYGEVTSIIEYLTDNLSNTFKLESGGNEDD